MAVLQVFLLKKLTGATISSIFILRVQTTGGRKGDTMFFDTPPHLISISGVSGSGKTTLINQLEVTFGGGRIITHTSRPCRPTESGHDYHFCTTEQIHALTDALWVKENYGNWYAVTASAVYQPLRRIGIGFLPTITSHHNTLHRRLPDVICTHIHLLAPSVEELRGRLQKRGSDTATVKTRLREINRIDSKALADRHIKTVTPNTAEVTFVEVMGIIRDAQK